MRLRSRIAQQVAGFFLFLMVAAPGAPGTGLARPLEKEKLTPAELVRRHIESVGGAAALEKRKTFVMIGTCRNEILVGGRQTLDGTAQLVSRGEGINFLIDFAHADYNGEQLVTDGKKSTTAFSVPGIRFPLSDFLFTQGAILREGLFGGVLTTAWPLLDPEPGNAALKLKGTRKVDGQKLHQLEYRIRKRGGDARIRMFFSAEDFTHRLTTYEVQISARMGANPAQSAGQRVSRFKLEERFADFRDFDGLHLPATWVVQVSTQKTGASSLWQWTMKFDQSSDTHEVPDSFFVVN